METFIALIRGINVSGQKKLPMTELKAHMEALGFKDIKTYIQSGNVLFKNENAGAKTLAEQIQKKILDVYGYKVSVLVKTPAELENLIENNPFHDRDLSRLYVTFLDKEPEKSNIEKLKNYDYSPEEYLLKGSDIYFFSPHGYGNAKMNNNFFESKLKVAATTRNWKTVNKLLDMTREM